MKYKVIGISALAAISLASTAFAQSVNVNVGGRASSTGVKAEVKAEVDARLASSTERRASSTERRIDMQIDLAQEKAERTAKRMSATIERLEKIIIRLESRIAKVEAAGGNVTEPKAYVAEAKVHLSQAKSNLALLVSIDLDGDKANENFAEVRDAASEVKLHIREAHRSLMNAVRSLGRIRASVNATSTATTTTQ